MWIKRFLIAFCFCCLLFPVSPGIDFDGADDRIDLGDDSDFDFWDAKFTVCAWVKISSSADNDHILFSKYSSDGAQRAYIVRIQSSGEMRHVISANGLTTSVETTTGTISTDTWEAIAYVCNGSDITMYLNGGSENFTHSVSGISDEVTPVIIGNIHFSGSSYPQPYEGEIGDLAVWSTNLSSAEVNLYLNSRIKGIALQIQPSELVGYWPMDFVEVGNSRDGDSIIDLSSFGNHGTGVDGANNTGFSSTAETILSYPPKSVTGG